MADAAGTGTQNIYPDSWSGLTTGAANYAAGFPEWGNQVYENWYQQPLSTGQTGYLTQAYNAMMNPDQQWVGGVQAAQQAAGQAQPYIQQSAQMYQQGSQYDPSQLNQFLNPYTQQAGQAVMNEANRNLTENIMPGVNSTFTGAGQFGSTRNAEFGNRAIRDTQSAVTDALAKANYGAFQNANQNYLDWAKLGQGAAAGVGSLAGQQLDYAGSLGDLAGAGAGLTQQQIANMLTAAQSQQQLQQQGLTANYQDWLTQQQFPLSNLGGLSQAIGGMSSGVRPDTYTPTQQPDDVSRVMAMISAVQAGLNDTSIQSIINSLWPEGGFTLG